MPYQPNHVFKGVVTKVGAMRKTATVTVREIAKMSQFKDLIIL